MSQVLPSGPTRSDHPLTLEGGPAGSAVPLGWSDGLELEYPVRLVTPPAWLGHTPFAFWLIGALRPRVLVELGVHTGNSYCAFAQAVKSRALDTRCFGIDHWRGDAHSGLYGDGVYEELRAHHDPLYGAFSTLLRSSFEEALTYFSDSSIDMLHIDGFHSYEAVAHDFNAWLSRMSSRGVVLLHDTNVRERGFGIWRFWEELTARYPTLELTHSYGLGIAYVGREPLCGPFATLFGTKTDAEIKRIRDYFARLGKSVVDRFALDDLTTKIDAAMRAGEAASARAADCEARLRTATADCEARLRTATRQVESQASLVRRRMLIMARLQQELLAANRTLNEVFQSKSWRLTGPIRSAGARLRRLLGRSA